MNVLALFGNMSRALGSKRRGAYLCELGCRDREVVSFDATDGEGREEGGRNECGEHFGGICTKSGWRAEELEVYRPWRERARKASGRGGCDARKTGRALSTHLPIQHPQAAR